MKNYSRNKAAQSKTAFRTGDRWRVRKNISTRNVKSLHQWKNTLPKKTKMHI